MTLKDRREAAGLTQEQVANLLDISVSYYSLLENCKRRMSLEMAKNLARILQCSLDDVCQAYEACRLDAKGVSADA